LPFNFTENIHQYGFKRLLLAVSGGLDSICMAHYFISNKVTLGIEWLGIAHVHHGLREGTADRDAAFVEAFARKYNIPFFLKHLDGNALKAAEGSLEEIAREARYKALAEVAEGATIVTAHHAGDQAETLYMRLRRGTTLAGLRGIQEVRALDPSTTPNDFTQDGISIYRPFLNTTRAELHLYAKENNLEWCEDESNADVKFARNKIRHEILPHLEKTCPGATKRLCKVAGLADKAYGKVMKACEELFAPSLCNGLLHPACNDVQLNKKALRKVLLEHADADLSEMFRLWLSEQGFRFPIGFFFAPKEPAHVKIPHRAAYRKRAIVKLGSTIRICEFESVEAALKFVSCKK
jgi:tRNA(Ile)-lysidine synthase